MSKKLFFYEKDDELCYPLSFIKEKMKSLGLTEKTIFEAVPDKETKDYFFCSYFNGVNDKGICDKGCVGYEARNKISGCCRHVGRLYEAGKEKLVKLNINEKRTN